MVFKGGGGQRYSPPGDGVSMFASLQFAELAVTMSTFFMHMNSFLVRGEVFLNSSKKRESVFLATSFIALACNLQNP